MIRSFLAVVLALGVFVQSIVFTIPAHAQELRILETQAVQEIADFLRENKLTECFQKNSENTRKPITALELSCLLFRSTGEGSIRPPSALRMAIRLGVLPEGTVGSQTFTTAKAFEAAFKVYGIPVPLVVQKKDWPMTGLRPTDPGASAARKAVDIGLLKPRSAVSRAKRISRIGVLSLLYQLSLIDRADAAVLRIDQGATVENVPLLDTLDQVLHILKQRSYFSDQFDDKKAMAEALKALVKSLKGDKYVEYYTDEEYRNFFTELQGKVFGIGAYIEQKEDKIVIVSPIKDTPADKAGVLPGDVVLKIDDVSTKGMTLQEAVTKIRGPKGSTVKLQLQRNGSTVELTIVRDEISVPSLKRTQRDGVEIVQLLQFNEGLDVELLPILKEIQQQNPPALIIDLRNNPGGFLNTVISILEFFVGKDKPVVVIQSKERETTIQAEEDAFFKDIPIAVLVNKGSASASEILAGVLQAYGLATIYGETSFGKGTVQEILPLPDGAIKYTTAEWVIPAGIRSEPIHINGKGIVPDVVTTLDDPATKDVDEGLDALMSILRPQGRRR